MESAYTRPENMKATLVPDCSYRSTTTERLTESRKIILTGHGRVDDVRDVDNRSSHWSSKRTLPTTTTNEKEIKQPSPLKTEHHIYNISILQMNV